VGHTLLLQENKGKDSFSLWVDQERILFRRDGQRTDSFSSVGQSRTYSFSREGQGADYKFF
jgi:hypothetical protein